MKRKELTNKYILTKDNKIWKSINIVNTDQTHKSYCFTMVVPWYITRMRFNCFAIIWNVNSGQLIERRLCINLESSIVEIIFRITWFINSDIRFCTINFRTIFVAWLVHIFTRMRCLRSTHLHSRTFLSVWSILLSLNTTISFEFNIVLEFWNYWVVCQIALCKNKDIAFSQILPPVFIRIIRALSCQWHTWLSYFMLLNCTASWTTLSLKIDFQGGMFGIAVPPYLLQYQYFCTLLLFEKLNAQRSRKM